MEAAPRIELGIKVLQTSALPLGYAAIIGAENGARTRDPDLGKVVLYHWATSAYGDPDQIWTDAVSYTHLDVYKRQVVAIPLKKVFEDIREGHIYDAKTLSAFAIAGERLKRLADK